MEYLRNIYADQTANMGVSFSNVSYSNTSEQVNVTFNATVELDYEEPEPETVIFEHLVRYDISRNATSRTQLDGGDIAGKPFSCGTECVVAVKESCF